MFQKKIPGEKTPKMNCSYECMWLIFQEKIRGKKTPKMNFVLLEGMYGAIYYKKKFQRKNLLNEHFTSDSEKKS
jgi:hypothetical protein